MARSASGVLLPLIQLEVLLVVVNLTPVTDALDYGTIATLGNAQDFGDLTVARQHAGSAASPTVQFLLVDMEQHQITSELTLIMFKL